MLSLESPHRGDSNEFRQYTIFNILKKENHPKLLYPRHTKYVEGYIVFVFPSIRPVLTFYVKVLREVFFYTSRNGAGQGYPCPSGHLF